MNLNKAFNNPRVIVVQKLYGQHLNKESEVTFPKHRYKKFIKDVVNGTIERKEFIQNLMDKELKNDINNNRTELIIKLMIMAAIYEFMFMHKTPIKVIISEYLISPDIIVFLQATSPLRLIDDIDNALKHFLNEKADSLFSVTKFDDLTLWKKENNRWKSLNFDYKNRLRRQNMSVNYIENGSIYIFKPEILIKYNNRLGGKMIIYEMKFWQTWEIDSMQEVDLIEYYMKKYNLD